MPTVKIIQRIDKIRRDGTAPLHIRMTQHRRSRYRSLRVNLLPEHWDQEGQRVKKAHPFSTRLNARLAAKRLEYEELALELEQNTIRFRLGGLKQLIAGPASASFLDAAFATCDELDRQGRRSTANNYRQTFAQLRDWLQEHKQISDLSFADLSPALAREFRDYLKHQRGNQPNTIKVKFAALRKVMNQAQRDGIISETQNTLRNFITPGKRTRKQIPNQEEMQRIAALDLPADSPLRPTRDLFLFSARMAGIRFSDVLTLRWGMVRGRHLQWQTRKTGKQLRLWIPDAAWEILERYRSASSQSVEYIFPFLCEVEQADLDRCIGVANARCNRDLKRICELAGFDRSFSFHAARHYFATEALRSGMRVEVLKEIMTHSSLEQTMQYVRIVGADLDEAMRRLG